MLSMLHFLNSMDLVNMLERLHLHRLLQRVHLLSFYTLPLFRHCWSIAPVIVIITIKTNLFVCAIWTIKEVKSIVNMNINSYKLRGILLGTSKYSKQFKWKSNYSIYPSTHKMCLSFLSNINNIYYTCQIGNPFAMSNKRDWICNHNNYS